MPDEVVKGLLAVLIFGLIALLGWVVGGGAKKTTEGETVLRYGGALRGLGALMALVVLILAGLLLASLLGVGPSEGAQRPILMMIALGSAIGLPLFIEGFRRRVTLSEEGITVRGWFGTRPLVRWEEIQRIENWVMFGKFVVRARKAKFSLSHYLEGLGVFIEESKQRLPVRVYGRAFDKPIVRP